MKKPAQRKHQVAALPYRRLGNGVEVLLVTSRETRRWVIPKGWPMKGKKDWNAAAVEAFEEAGIEGRISKKSIGKYRYEKRRMNGTEIPVSVTVYLLEVEIILGSWPEKVQRRRKWVSPDEAQKLVNERGLKAIIAATLS